MRFLIEHILNGNLNLGPISGGVTYLISLLLIWYALLGFGKDKFSSSLDIIYLTAVVLVLAVLNAVFFINLGHPFAALRDDINMWNYSVFLLVDAFVLSAINIYEGWLRRIGIISIILIVALITSYGLITYLK